MHGRLLFLVSSGWLCLLAPLSAAEETPDSEGLQGTWFVGSTAATGPSSKNAENGEHRGNGRAEAEKSLDLSFIPDDCFLAIVIHPQRIAGSPPAKQLSEDATEELCRQLTNSLGVDPRKIDEMAILLSARTAADSRFEPTPQSGRIIRFAEPIATRELLVKMYSHVDFADEQSKYRGKTFYTGQYEWRTPEDRGPEEGPADVAVHFPDARTMVLSDEAMLKRMLSADEPRSELIRRLRKAGGEYELVIVATAEVEGASLEKLAREVGNELPPGLNWLLNVPQLGSAVTITADVRSAPRAEIVVEANDADSVARIRELADDEILAVNKALRSTPQEEIQQLGFAVAKAIFGKVRITDEGETLTVTFDMTEAMAKLPEYLASLADAERARRHRLERRVRTPGQVGMIVVYEIDRDETPPGAGPSDADRRVLMAALGRRLNPGDHTSGQIRQREDGRIEVSIYRADREVLHRIADLLPRPGTLEFRILADKLEHSALIQRARAALGKGSLHDATGNLVAWWVPLSRGTELDGHRDVVVRVATQGDRQVRQVLVVNDEFNVTGAHVEQAAASTDVQLRPSMELTLNEAGSRLLAGLTGSNIPKNGFYHKLGVLIDGKLCSAPRINAKVSKKAMISGDFTQEEVNDLVDLLNAGPLPVAIRRIETRMMEAEK